jgi:hypothetical protein
VISYLISILLMMIVFLSFFLATQNSTNQDEHDEV